MLFSTDFILYTQIQMLSSYIKIISRLSRKKMKNLVNYQEQKLIPKAQLFCNY